MLSLVCLVQYVLMDSLPGMRIIQSGGSSAIWRVGLSLPLSPGFEKEVERAVHAWIKKGKKPESADLERTSAISRFKELKQTFFARVCSDAEARVVSALKLKNFYMPLEESLDRAPDYPPFFELIGGGSEELFICAATSKAELKILKSALNQRGERNHEALGKEFFYSVSPGYAGYTPKGASAKNRVKQFLCKKAAESGARAVSFRGGEKPLWDFLALLPKGAYFQLEPIEKPRRCGLIGGLFNLRCEGALTIRQIGSKEDLQSTLNSSLQMIDDILRIGDICDISSFDKGKGKSYGRLSALSALHQDVLISEWSIRGEKFEFAFYVDRWIGVLIEHDSKRAAEWLMIGDHCIEN